LNDGAIVLKFLHAFVFLGCLIPLLGQAANNATGAGSVQKIEKLLQEGRLDDAEKELQLAKSADNSNPRLKFLQCVVLAQQAATKKAMACFQQWNREHPEVPEAYNNIGVLYAGMGMQVEARKWFESGLKQQQAYFSLYQNLLNLQSEMTRHAYASALQLDMSKTTAQAKLGLLGRITSVPDQVLSVVSAPAMDKPVLSAANPSSALNTPGPVVSALPGPKPALAAPKSAPASPEPGQALDPAAVLAQQSRIREAVLAWSAAWAQKDFETYIKAYAPGFSPGGQMSLAAWEEQRRLRILSKKQIQIELGQMKIQMAGVNSKAMVTFVQKYESGAVVTVSRKTLEMVEEKGTWLISREFVSGG
jgi:tetratricopeptide (TPR) repeat protein